MVRVSRFQAVGLRRAVKCRKDEVARVGTEVNWGLGWQMRCAWRQMSRFVLHAKGNVCLTHDVCRGSDRGG